MQLSLIVLFAFLAVGTYGIGLDYLIARSQANQALGLSSYGYGSPYYGGYSGYGAGLGYGYYGQNFRAGKGLGLSTYGYGLPFYGGYSGYGAGYYGNGFGYGYYGKGF